MDYPLSLGILENKENGIIKTFTPEGPTNTDSMDLEQFASESVHAIFCSEDLDLEELGEWSEKAPLIQKNELIPSFEGLNYQQGLELIKKQSDQWAYKNLLEFLPESWAIIEDMRSIFHQKRNEFVKDLFFLVKKLTGALFIKMVYHDLDENKKLKKMTIEGASSPKYAMAGEFEVDLLSFYGRAIDGLRIEEYNPEKGELTMAFKIRNGPFVLMAQVPSMDQLKLAALKMIFKGLDRPMKKKAQNLAPEATQGLPTQ